MYENSTLPPRFRVELGVLDLPRLLLPPEVVRRCFQTILTSGTFSGNAGVVERWRHFPGSGIQNLAGNWFTVVVVVVVVVVAFVVDGVVVVVVVVEFV